MELEFDKEIDSLLRRADRGAVARNEPGDRGEVHLDADELSAFVENAMPERMRALHMAHLADCDRCRRILSGLIAMNADEAADEIRTPAPAVSPPVAAEPWYRRFFLFPNLAYVMGGLVLIFGGLLTFSLLQNPLGESAIVSQSVETDSARGPMEPMSPADEIPQSANAANTVANVAAFNANSSVAASSSSNAATNTASNTFNPGLALAPRGEAEAAKPSEKPAISADGVDAKTTDAVTAAPPPAPAVQPEQRKDAELATGAPLAKIEEKARAKKREADAKDDSALTARQVQELPRTQAGGVLKSTPGPSRDAQQNFPNRANNTYNLPTMKRVSGKSFEFRSSVWYDISYRGQATKNVRRGTDEYRDLDKGLRSIAESLSGVVVVVWEGKAYRIQ